MIVLLGLTCFLMIDILIHGLGKQRRLQFVECPNDINGMIDCAKFADLALLLIDGSYGFEMVSFLYGFPLRYPA